MTTTIVLATRNKGKIAELERTLSDFGLTVIGLDAFPEIGDIVEDGVTFEENSLIKARTVALATGHIAVADDSGLEVDALNGAPGVYSARYSSDRPDLPGPGVDDRNNQKLLEALAAVPDEKRTARFRCVMSAYAPNGEYITASGAWEGRIGHEYKGDNGFGFDPLFIDPVDGKHSAELPKEEKNRRSHRGNALKALLVKWPAFWAKVNNG
ncbi:RdgB/HAM1 family non-canonical purine NTP pyrophosphatase [Desulfovibrio subterraneus]|uniref:dITP/XTP pyrophosphatase n=1 Tax=Desulfovibrio subterraneus TaxID=2718620 RepID=A0A7J0BFB6_9BACT|nr:RdgB/HAM1 family non-canonical purine NTP pyrophosphatase [Desulfovibrio subterraneus]WBF68696.1 RdgB/HAM1 family non-canonical purine NTP pyrophosphatase [Desulfovibrio subterraneus]GFM31882.1 non-canonical purine NTP pyrophosphatase [Desulfovibrio subterraneus]